MCRIAARAMRHAYRCAGALAVLLCATLHAQAAQSAQAADLEMIAPAMPPHFDAQGHGRVADAVRTALARRVHHVHFTVVPFGRHWADYEADARFGALPQRLISRDEHVRDDFERCMAALHRNGELERIAAPCVERYRAIVSTAYTVK